MTHYFDLSVFFAFIVSNNSNVYTVVIILFIYFVLTLFFFARITKLKSFHIFIIIIDSQLIIVQESVLLTTNLRKVFYHFTTSKVRKIKELSLRHRANNRTYTEAVVCFNQQSGYGTTILYIHTLPSEFPIDYEVQSVSHALHSPPCKIAIPLSICLIQHLNPMLL